MSYRTRNCIQEKYWFNKINIISRLAGFPDVVSGCRDAINRVSTSGNNTKQHPENPTNPKDGDLKFGGANSMRHLRNVSLVVETRLIASLLPDLP